MNLGGRWLLAILREQFVASGEGLSWCATKAIDFARATEPDDGIYERAALLIDHISLAEYKLEGSLAECRAHLLKTLSKYPLPPVTLATASQAFRGNCLRTAG